MKGHIFNLARTVYRAKPTITLTREVTEKAWVAVKAGKNIVINDVPYEVTKALQGGRGRGASFVKTKLKNLITGKSLDKTFNSEDPVEIPELDRYDVEYSWDDENDFVFLDGNTFEEFRVAKNMVAKSKFLLPGQSISVFKYKTDIISVVFPHTAEYVVTDVDTTERMLVYCFSFYVLMICDS